VDYAPEGVGDQTDFQGGSQTDYPGSEGVGDRTDFLAGRQADFPPEGIGDRTDLTPEVSEGRTKPTGS